MEYRKMEKTETKAGTLYNSKPNSQARLWSLIKNKRMKKISFPKSSVVSYTE